MTPSVSIDDMNRLTELEFSLFFILDITINSPTTTFESLIQHLNNDNAQGQRERLRQTSVLDYDQYIDHERPDQDNDHDKTNNNTARDLGVPIQRQISRETQM